MLKKFFFFLGLNVIFFVYSVELDIKPEHYEKMNILVGLINPDIYLEKIASKIKADLEFGNQFNVKIEHFNQIKKKNDIAKLESLGCSIIIFLNLIFKNEKIGIQWRLYDSQANMIKGKQIFVKDYKDNFAHILADQILLELTGTQSSFATVIAACKKNTTDRKNGSSSIYILHPVELLAKLSHPKLIINEHTTCLSPRWNSYKPLLYYSKHTAYNVRLMCVDLNGKKSIVTNFEGLNLTPTFSEDKKIILSLTVEGKGRLCKYSFDEKTNKGIYVPLTDKKIHAVSPSFIDEQKVLFCSIVKSKSRIALLDLNNNKIEYLTKPDEYCISPGYCKKNNKISYCKKINGVFQIFITSLEAEDHRQITYCKGDKDSCSWSACGNYITFSIDNNKSSRIAIININNDEIKFLTPENEIWSNPCWSPLYQELAFLN